MSGRVNILSPLSRLFRHLSLQGIFVAAALVSGTVVSSAQTAPAFNPARANSGTLGVISGGADGT